MDRSEPELKSRQAGSAPSAARQPDAIYQNGRIVARVIEPQVDLEAKEIRFGELFNSDELVLADECEFQNYRILIKRVLFATKVEKLEPHKGRILRALTADILGYREQEVGKAVRD